MHLGLYHAPYRLLGCSGSQVHGRVVQASFRDFTVGAYAGARKGTADALVLGTE